MEPLEKDKKYILTFMDGSQLGPLAPSEISDEDHEDALLIEVYVPKAD